MNIPRMQSVLRALLTPTWTMDELQEAYAWKAAGRPYSRIARKLGRTIGEIHTAIR